MAERPMDPTKSLLDVGSPPVAWRVRLETHARATLANPATHPRYERDESGRLFCPTCGLLAPTAAELREGRA